MAFPCLTGKILRKDIKLVHVCYAKKTKQKRITLHTCNLSNLIKMFPNRIDDIVGCYFQISRIKVW